MFRELLRTVSMPIIISVMMKIEMMGLEILVYLQFSHLRTLYLIYLKLVERMHVWSVTLHSRQFG